EGTAPAHRPHHDLRHPRPDRGAHVRRRGRGDARGAGGAGGHARRTLRAPAPHLRGLFHRLARNEPARLRARRRPGPPRRPPYRLRRSHPCRCAARLRRPARNWHTARVRALCPPRGSRAAGAGAPRGRCRALPGCRRRLRGRRWRAATQAAGARRRGDSRRRCAGRLRADAHPSLRRWLDRHMSTKVENQKGWLFVLPVVLLVAFNAVIPLMTVVNYSVQETFGNNEFFFEGVTWFEQVLHSERFHQALGRQLLFTGIILLIEVPLGVAIALAMPRKGIWVSVCLVLMAMPLLIPWNVVGAMWNIFGLPEIGLLGRMLNNMGIDYNFTRGPIAAWATLVAMDVWHWTSLVVLLAYAGLSAIPDAYYQAARIDGASAWAVFRHIQDRKSTRLHS